MGDLEYEWDPAKAAANLAKHGVPFEAVEGFDWETVVEAIDDREDYGELRVRAYGFIGVRLHVLVYAPRGRRVRVIGLRRANQREEGIYAQAKEA